MRKTPERAASCASIPWIGVPSWSLSAVEGDFVPATSTDVAGTEVSREVQEAAETKPASMTTATNNTAANFFGTSCSPVSLL